MIYEIISWIYIYTYTPPPTHQFPPYSSNLKKTYIFPYIDLRVMSFS